MKRVLLLLVGSLLLTLSLSACGGTGDTGAGAASKVRTGENGDRINGADVRFATQMIPHHAQALEMVDLTTGRELSPELRSLAEQIREAQAPEIEQMTRWLTEWGEEVPATSRDHVNSGHDDGNLDQDMPGMMTTDDMGGLEAMRGAEFESMWLQMMTEHHRGAIMMARTERADGHFGAAKELAGAIIAAQEKEIAEIEALQGS
ncbi:MAG: DUF305 domain-containing protein [Marmoricola sp.]